MFRKMDTDNDGIVSIEELKSGLQNFGSQLAESEVQMLIEAVSLLASWNDSVNSISYHEEFVYSAICSFELSCGLPLDIFGWSF